MQTLLLSENKQKLHWSTCTMDLISSFELITPLSWFGQRTDKGQIQSGNRCL